MASDKDRLLAIDEMILFPQGALEWTLLVGGVPRLVESLGSSAAAAFSLWLWASQGKHSSIGSTPVTNPSHAVVGGWQLIASWQLKQKLFLPGWLEWSVSMTAAFIFLFHLFCLYILGFLYKPLFFYSSLKRCHLLSSLLRPHFP